MIKCVMMVVVVNVIEAGVGVQSMNINKAPRLENDEFQNKVVLVTGGSSGIGYETALEFARRGAHVVIASRDSNPSWFNGSTAANNINSDSQVIAANGTARWVKTDISKKDSVRNLFADIVRIDKQLDIAINNAAIGGALGTLNEVGFILGTELDPILNNLEGTANCLVEEINYWVTAKQNGIIVNTASENGLTGTPGGALYGASKFGIVGLTRSVALEFLTGTPVIRVNAIAPGLVNTSFTWQQVKYLEDGTQPYEGDYITPESELWKKWGPLWIAQLRSGTISEPSQQAAMILFLSSSAASYISGSVFSVDMGSTA